MTDLNRQAFENAAYNVYLEKHAKGQANEGEVIRPTALFNRGANDLYRVTEFNSAWWGWNASANRWSGVLPDGELPEMARHRRDLLAQGIVELGRAAGLVHANETPQGPELLTLIGQLRGRFATQGEL